MATWTAIGQALPRRRPPRSASLLAGAAALLLAPGLPFVGRVTLLPARLAAAAGAHAEGNLRVSRARLGAAASATVPELNKILTGDEFQAMRQAAGTTVVMFSSPFCGPCFLVEPKVVAMAQELGADVRFAKVSLEPGKSAADLKQLFTDLDVKELPTFLVFQHGEIRGKVTGTRADELRKVVDGLL